MTLEVVSESANLSIIFFIFLLLVITMIIFAFILIKRLSYDIQQISKSIIISLLITIWVEFLLFLANNSLPEPMCKYGGFCISNTNIFVLSFPYTFPIIFLSTLLMYLVKQ